MWYATGCAFNVHDLYSNFNVKKVGNAFIEKGGRHKLRTIYGIFITAILLIITDIIHNKVVFKLPLIGNNEAYIEMKTYKGEEFKNSFKKGKFNDVDFLASNYSGCQLNYRLKLKHRADFEKPIYISKKLKDLITAKVNAGITY